MESFRKCTQCKKNYELEHYQKGNKILKLCLKCRNVAKKSCNKTKCVHGRQKPHCFDCRGSSICHHNKRKQRCVDCGGIDICIHNKQKAYCRGCGGVGICQHNKHKFMCKECKSPIHITILKMIRNSKNNDKKYNRYNEAEFVDYDYLFNLIDISNDECYYCECQLQYINYQHNLATIERINNELGHIKSNVVIACRTCNYSHVGSR